LGRGALIYQTLLRKRERDSALIYQRLLEEMERCYKIQKSPWGGEEMI